MESAENHRQLTSWKEIAEYLGRDIRTCWRWEKKFGLPVHRVDPDSPKSRVYAFKDELDEWLHQKIHNRISGQRSPLYPSSRKFLLYVGIPALAAVGVILILSLPRISGPVAPADFRVKGSELVILSEKGRELWRYDTRIEDLHNERAYRSRFQTKKALGAEPGVKLPWIIIKDIYGDQEGEVLFCTWASNEREGGDLICFDHRGKEKWRFKAGREMQCGSRLYSRHYNIRGFNTLDIDDDGKLEILVISHQTPNWLTQLAILDSNGQVRGEFWNSGHLSDFMIEDLNGDGRKELLVTGLNNEYGEGCLIVFDPQNIAGGSPQTKAEFTCRDVKPGTEECYLIFPRTDVDQELGPVEAINEIYAELPDILSLKTALSGIYFILNFNLTVQDVTISHEFMQKHHEALLAGKIHSNLDDPAYKEALTKGVLYYDGREWTTQPTQVVHRD